MDYLWFAVFTRGYVVPARTEGTGDFAVEVPAIGWDDGADEPAGQRESRPLVVDKSAVYDAFRAEVRGQSHVDTSSVFWQNSRRLFDDAHFYEESRAQAGGVRTRTVTLPPLAQCIERWNVASSVQIE